MEEDKTELWQIVHIPDNPPVSPTQQPTVEVVASLIEPKHANTLIRRLNRLVPLENLRHVKRIQKRSVDGASENGNPSSSFTLGLQELMDSYQLSPFVTKVCKYAATSKEEWEEQCKLWPTSYHPPTFNIDGISGFSEEETRLICGYMKMAVDLAKSGDGSVVNAAVIVDPSTQHIIACGCDGIYSWQASSSTPCTKDGTLKEPAAVSSSHLHSNGAPSHLTALTVDKCDNPQRLSVDVSCLNPWLWSKRQLKTECSCFWHPLRHAAIVAIESSADRDRCLFPDPGHVGEKPFELESEQSSCPDSPAKRRKTSLGNAENEKELDAQAKDSHSLSTRPYLCTGYDIYLVWEPCTMCAMALVHQRIRRIFYGFPNRTAGALGSLHRLQGERSLNHHYAVFRVFLPEEVLGVH